MLPLPILVSVLAICTTLATNGNTIENEFAGNTIECMKLVGEERVDKEVAEMCRQQFQDAEDKIAGELTYGEDKDIEGQSTGILDSPTEEHSGFDKKSSKSFFGLPMKTGRSHDVSDRSGTQRTQKQGNNRPTNPSNKRKSFFGMPAMEGRSASITKEKLENIFSDVSLKDVHREHDQEGDVEKRKSFFGIPGRDGRSDKETAAVQEASSSNIYGIPNSVTRTDVAEGLVKAEELTSPGKRKSFFGIPIRGSRSDGFEKRKSFFGIPLQSGRSVDDINIEGRASKSFFGLPQFDGRSLDDSMQLYDIPSLDGQVDEVEKRTGGHRRKAYPGMPYAYGKRAADQDMLDNHARDRRSPETTSFDDNDVHHNTEVEKLTISKRGDLRSLYARGKVYAGMPIATIRRNYRPPKPQAKRSVAESQAFPMKEQNTDLGEVDDKRSPVRRKIFGGMPTAFRRGRPSHKSAAITGKLFMGMPVPEF